MPAERHVVVAALTYRRADGLDRLLTALGEQHRDPDRPYRLTVLIVDNDADASARAAVAGWQARAPFRLDYVVEPEQGIPFGRNRALDSAPQDADLFCFVDDDEWPTSGWLDALLRTRDATGADIVYGPVEPVFPDEVSRWFVRARVFDRKHHADAASIGYAATNNVMFDLPRVRDCGLRFSAAMRFTGGSDYLFFQQARRCGLSIHWSAAALVYDTIPATRMTWRWVMQRQYRLGNTFAVASRLDERWPKRAARFGYGLARMGAGAAMTPALVVSPYWGMRGVTHLLRGAGLVVGLMGHKYDEYAIGSDRIAS